MLLGACIIQSRERQLFPFLKENKVDIALLQETHTEDAEHVKQQRDWVGKVLFNLLLNSTGVCISTILTKIAFFIGNLY